MSTGKKYAVKKLKLNMLPLIKMHLSFPPFYHNELDLYLLILQISHDSQKDWDWIIYFKKDHRKNNLLFTISLLMDDCFIILATCLGLPVFYMTF